MVATYYQYEFTFDPPISLDAGTYWIGFRIDSGVYLCNTAATAYWRNSDGGVHTSGTGWYAADGISWVPKGSGWQFAFILEFCSATATTTNVATTTVRY